MGSYSTRREGDFALYAWLLMRRCSVEAWSVMLSAVSVVGGACSTERSALEEGDSDTFESDSETVEYESASDDYGPRDTFEAGTCGSVYLCSQGCGVGSECVTDCTDAACESAQGDFELLYSCIDTLCGYICNSDMSAGICTDCVSLSCEILLHKCLDNVC